MDARKRARTVTVHRHGVQVARTEHDGVAVGAQDRHRRADGQDQGEPAAAEARCSVRQRCLRLRQGRQGAQRDPLHREVDQRRRDDHRQQRKRDVAARVAVFARGCGQALEAGIGVQQQQRRFAEVAQRDFHDQRRGQYGIDVHCADADEHDQRQHLGDRQEDAGARGGAHAEHVDRDQQRERSDHDRDPHHAAGRVRPEMRYRLGQAVAQCRSAGDAPQQQHPADFEADQRTECLACIQVAAARLVEIARGLRVAQHQQADREPGQQYRPRAGRAQQGRRGSRQQIDATADDAVDRHSVQLPAADCAPHGRAGGIRYRYRAGGVHLIVFRRAGSDRDNMPRRPAGSPTLFSRFTSPTSVRRSEPAGSSSIMRTPFLPHAT